MLLKFGINTDELLTKAKIELDKIAIGSISESTPSEERSSQSRIEV
jgi:hypothetical protein